MNCYLKVVLYTVEKIKVKWNRTGCRCYTLNDLLDDNNNRVIVRAYKNISPFTGNVIEIEQPLCWRNVDNQIPSAPAILLLPLHAIKPSNNSYHSNSSTSSEHANT